MQAKYIKNISVIDPDTNVDVELIIFKEDSGLMFAIEAIFPNDEPILSPYGNGTIEVDGDEDQTI